MHTTISYIDLKGQPLDDIEARIFPPAAEKEAATREHVEQKLQLKG